MKKNILLFSLIVLFTYGIAWAQTGYGGIFDPATTTGTTGDITNSYFGDQAGVVNVIGILNTFLGSNTGFNNTNGSNNTFVGSDAGTANTDGDNNTFIGSGAGLSNLIGSGNVFLGYQAGFNETNSDRLYIANSNTDNPLIWGDFLNNILHINNTLGIGLNPNMGDLPTQALDVQGTARLRAIPQDNSLTQVLVSDNNGNINWREANSLSSDINDFPSFPDSAGDGGGITNAYFGIQAGDANTLGTDNTFLGNQSGINAGGNSNTFIGSGTGTNNLTGSGNVFLGYQTGSNEVGSDRLYIDNSNTASPLLWGNFAADILNVNGTVGIGLNPDGGDLPTQALDVNGNARVRNIPENATNDLTRVLVADTDGNFNWRTSSSLEEDINIFPSFPASAGNGGNNTNSYFGHEAGLINDTGIQNTFIGRRSGFANVTGTANTFVGEGSGTNNDNGSANTFIGRESGGSNVNGNNNTFLGYESGRNATGSNNVFLGYQAGFDESGSNRLYVDNSGTVTPLIWGDFTNDILNVNGNIGIGLDPDGGDPPTQPLDVQGTARLRNIPQDNTLTQLLVSDNNGNINWRAVNSLSADINAFPSYPESAGDGGGNTNSYFGHLSGVSNTGSNNTFLGHQSGTANGAGVNNTFVGSGSGSNNINGSNNTFLGQDSGFNTTGSGNIFLGYRAGRNELGSDRLYIDNSDTDSPLIWGDLAGDILNLNGIMGIGLNPNMGDLPTQALDVQGTARLRSIPQDNALTQLLVSDADGNINWRAANSLSSDVNIFPSFPASAGDGGGNTNAYFGHLAGVANTTGTDNTFLGNQSGTANNTGANNTFVGSGSGSSNIAGSNNTFLGQDSGGDATGSGNIFLGYQAGRNELASDRLYIDNSDTASPLLWGNFAADILNVNGTVGIGLNPDGGDLPTQTLDVNGNARVRSIPENAANDLNRVLVADIDGNLNWRTSASLEADINIFPSYPESAGNGGGNTNSYFGHEAGVANDTGIENTFIGHRSGLANVSGSDNTFVGSDSGNSNSNGTNNTFVGSDSGNNNTNGISNTFVGSGSGSSSNGSNNTFLGQDSGFNTTGSGNVFLGYQAGRNELGSDRLYIDNSDTASPLLWGNFSTDILNVNGTLGIGLNPDGGDLPTQTLDVNGNARVRNIPENAANDLDRILVADTDGNLNWRTSSSLEADINTFPSFPDSAGDGGGNTNAYFGHEAGVANDTGIENTFIGHRSGLANVSGSDNTFVGSGSGSSNINGNNNTFLGQDSGGNAVGSGNIFLGYQAGRNELGSDRLYIDNSDTSSPLLWGNFSTDILNVNGTVGIGLNPDGGDLPTQTLDVNGNARVRSIPENVANDLTRILVSDIDGNLNWRTSASLEADIHTFPSYPESAGDDGGNTNAYFGHLAGVISTGDDNTFLGHESGTANTIGADNTFVGSDSGESNLTGNANTFMGYRSGAANISGMENTFIGTESGQFNIDGSNNTFIGYSSGHENTNGGSNTFLGFRSGYTNTTGSGNVFLGYEAGYNETGSNLLYIDNSNTTDPLLWGDFANDLLRFNGSVSISTIPQDDTLTQVLVSDTDGAIHWRTAATLDTQRTDDEIRDVVGAMVSGNTETLINVTYDNVANLLNFEVESDLSLYDNSTSGFISNPDDADADPNNEFQMLSYDPLTQALSIDGPTGNTVDLSGLAIVDNLGNHQVLQSLLPDTDNTYDLGGNGLAYSNIYFDNSLFINDTEFLHTRSNNIAIGTLALNAVGVGSQNVALGEEALAQTTSGTNNTAIGNEALRNNITGNFNTAIGNNARTFFSGFVNTTAIGNDVLVLGSNQVRIGNSSVNSIGGFANWSNLSDGRFKKAVAEDIPGIAFIEQLRPVSYELDHLKLQEFLGEGSFTGEAGRRSIGFIAQEVDDVVRSNNFRFTGIEKPLHEKGHYSIRYAEFVVPLVKAVQEQQEHIKTLTERIETLERLLGNSSQQQPEGSDEENKVANSEGFVLYQNVPNPFDKATAIRAVLPQEVYQAKIIIYNLQGLELEQYPIAERGEVSVAVSAGRFPSGMYIYALVADEKIIDTKKMILTK